MKQKRLLILEDDRDLLLNMVAFFEDEGFDCVGADNAEEAIKILNESQFHLAIVDIGLPKMSGEEFITAVNKINPTIKFVIHTGQNNFKLSNELRELKIKEQHVFRKPLLDFSDLTKELILLTN